MKASIKDLREFIDNFSSRKVLIGYSNTDGLNESIMIIDGDKRIEIVAVPFNDRTAGFEFSITKKVPE